MGTHPIFESDFDCLTDWENAEIPIAITWERKTRKFLVVQLKFIVVIQLVVEFVFLIGIVSITCATRPKIVPGQTTATSPFSLVLAQAFSKASFSISSPSTIPLPTQTKPSSTIAISKTTAKPLAQTTQ